MATTTKIVDMETVCNNVREITDQWKKMFHDEFFARLNNGYALITNFGAPTAATAAVARYCPVPLRPRCPLHPAAAMHLAASPPAIPTAVVPPSLWITTPT